MRDTAESLLVSEIAIAKSRTQDKVRGELEEIFAVPELVEAEAAAMH